MDRFRLSQTGNRIPNRRCGDSQQSSASGLGPRPWEQRTTAQNRAHRELAGQENANQFARQEDQEERPLSSRIYDALVEAAGGTLGRAAGGAIGSTAGGALGEIAARAAIRAYRGENVGTDEIAVLTTEVAGSDVGRTIGRAVLGGTLGEIAGGVAGLLAGREAGRELVRSTAEEENLAERASETAPNRASQPNRHNRLNQETAHHSREGINTTRRIRPSEEESDLQRAIRLSEEDDAAFQLAIQLSLESANSQARRSRRR